MNTYPVRPSKNRYPMINTSRSPGRCIPVIGKFSVKNWNYLNTRAQTLPLAPPYFFPWSMSTHLEAQKNPEQKNQSTLEINSHQVGGIPKKVGNFVQKSRFAWGFHWKSNILWKSQNIRYQWKPQVNIDFWTKFSTFFGIPPTWCELISKVDWFFCSGFFCASRWVLMLHGKKYGGANGSVCARVFK